MKEKNLERLIDSMIERNRVAITPCNRAVSPVHVFCLFLFLFVFFLAPVMSWGHGPKDVELTYDTGSRTLSVTIFHAVSNPQKHYIKAVSIIRNGELVTKNEYTGQPDPSSFSYTYTIEAKPGDTLEVTADCNYFGSKTGELTLDK